MMYPVSACSVAGVEMVIELSDGIIEDKPLG